MCKGGQRQCTGARTSGALYACEGPTYRVQMAVAQEGYRCPEPNHNPNPNPNHKPYRGVPEHLPEARIRVWVWSERESASQQTPRPQPAMQQLGRGIGLGWRRVGFNIAVYGEESVAV